MGSAKGGQTIGYKYYLSLLSGLCRGPINELRAIKVGDKIAWDSHACGPDAQYIDKPDLFGGDEKEGGIQGPFRVFMGAADQILPGASGGLPDVKASIGGPVSEFRGTVCVWYDGLVSAMSPYLKEWKFRVRRSNKGWFQDAPWYPAKAIIFLSGPETITQKRAIEASAVWEAVMGIFTGKGGSATQSVTISVPGNIHAMNGAHTIYECCTNPEWGRGLPTDMIDENAFVYAANRLCSEMFGICLVWYRKEDIDVFIKKVLDLIGGVLYVDRETGKTVLRLVRDDYVAEDLPLFTPDSGLLEIMEDDSGSVDTSFNEVIGTGVDPISNQEFQMRAQNLAGFQAQQAISSLDQDYRGIPTKELLARLVLRDLRANAAGLKRYKVALDRRGWRLAPGMPFRVSDAARGIDNVILRAGEINDGNMVNGRIEIKAIVDVFGLPDTSYMVPVEPGWTPPVTDAIPATMARLIEAGYRDTLLRIGQANAEALEADQSFIGQLALAPTTLSYQFDLASKADGEPDFTITTNGSFTGSATLTDAIAPLDTEFLIGNTASFDVDNVGQAILVGDEMMRLDDYDDETGIATVTRGVADTIPQAHAAAVRLWTIDDDLIGDGRSYAIGETVVSRVLTRTSSDRLAIDEALPEMTVDLDARQNKPYAPGDVKVDGDSIFALAGDHAEPEITWAERNRISQADHMVGHGEATIMPEVGTTYTIRIYDVDDNLLRTEDGITGTTWTYDATMQGADVPTSVIYVELEAVRDDVVSWQRYRFTVVLNGGWGYGWGFNWGGGS